MLLPQDADRRLVYAGQQLEVDGEFRRNGELLDPTIVKLYSKAPGGSVVVLTYPHEDLVRLSVGRYVGNVFAATPGSWSFRLEGAGVIDAVQDIQVEVLPSVFV